MHIKINTSTIFFVVSFSVLFANNILGQPITKAVIINSDRGLSQNSVYSIFKDHKGFLWIGTGDGLNRYDGKDFVIFRNTSINSEHSLKGFSITYNMQEDNLHNLWFSTERNLVRYDQVANNFTEIIPFDDSIHSQGNKSMISIDTLVNTAWFFSTSKCLYSFNYIDKKFKQYDFPLKESQKNPFLNSHGVADKTGNIWITSADGLFCFNKKAASWQQFHKGRRFKEICIDDDANLWMISSDSLFCYDPHTLSLIIHQNHSSKSGAYISIAADNKGKIWTGTIDGKLYFSTKHNREAVFAGNINSLTGTKNIFEPRCLYFDQSNLLWIGTEGSGVIKIDLNPKNFNKYPSGIHFPLNSLYIKSILCTENGKVWLGTFKKGVYIFDPATMQAKKLSIPKNKDFNEHEGTVYSIKKDNNDIYWIGYNGTLIAYNQKTNRYFFHPVPLDINENYSIINHIEVQNNYLILSTITGIYKVVTAQNGQRTAFSKIYNAAASESRIISDGSLWASSLYAGLIKILPGENRLSPNLFSRNGFRCITEDKENQILWAASQTGLLAYHLPTGKSKLYDERNGLLNGYLYGIIKNGNEVWVSSNKGIARGPLLFNKEDILPEIAFKGYTKNDGLQSNEFNTGAYDIAKDGTIFFGGINGLNWFLPGNISINHHKPSVAITSLKINDIIYADTPSVEYLQSITVPYKNNSLTLKFIGIEFSNPESIHYRIKLDGLEKDWIPEQNAREIRYANLPPGKYIFRVIAANSDDVLSNEASLAIHILPPFYSTWWFRLLITVITLFFIILVTKKASQFKLKKRIRMLEKDKALEEERHRISKEMHDDLGAGLTQISLISEAAKRRNKTGRFPGEELNDISNTSKQLIENVSEIIWAMNPEFDTFSGMIAYLREQISKLLEYSGKQYHIQMPENFTEMAVSNIRRKNIVMLLKEAINNAIKHSDATSIDVTIILINNYLEIKIRDNGNGFDMSKDKTGNGLKNYSYRAGLLNGMVKVNSCNTGTTVHFDIPLMG